MVRARLALVVTAISLLGIAVLGGCQAPRESAERVIPAALEHADPADMQRPADAITVFAGAASKPALEQLASVYEARSGVKVDITFGGSGAVLTQFTQEQYGDVYIPGSDDFMDKAEAKGAVLKDTRTPLVDLVPTICVAKGNPKDIQGLEDLARDGLRVVIGDIKAVCLGDIAQQMLQAEGLWDKVEPRIVSYAGNCEDVLNTLLLGEADAVIGWDAWPRQYPEKVEGVALPAGIARPRNIPAAVIKWSKQPEAAKAFIEFLTAEEAQSSFKEHGYTVHRQEPQ